MVRGYGLQLGTVGGVRGGVGWQEILWGGTTTAAKQPEVGGRAVRLGGGTCRTPGRVSPCTKVGNDLLTRSGKGPGNPGRDPEGLGVEPALERLPSVGTERLPGKAGTVGWGGDTTGLKDSELKSLRSLGPNGLVPTVLEETERGWATLAFSSWGVGDERRGRRGGRREDGGMWSGPRRQ